jgi:hypothetical protein
MSSPTEQPIIESGAAPYDQTNRLLGETPAEMTASVVQTSAGQRLALTFRTASTTFTVFPDRAVANAWRGMITSAVAEMNGFIVPPGVRR